MKKIAYQRLVVENFKSFVGETVIDFDALGPGLFYVRGDNCAEPDLEGNGAGKSSIFDAICWCLYGKTPDGLRNPDLRPWDDKAGTTRVQLRLLVDGKRRTVERTIAPNRLTLGNKDAGQSDVDRVFGMSMPVFLQTGLLGQGKPLFLDRTPGEKMALFGEVLDLDRWDRRADAAADKARGLDDDVQKIVNALDVNDRTRGLNEKTLASAREQHAEWESAREERSHKADAELEKLRGELEKLEISRDAADKELDASETEARALETASAEANKKIFALDQVLNERAAEVRAAERRVDEILAELERAEESGRCPACGQVLRSAEARRAHRDGLEDELSRLKAVVAAGMPRKKIAARDRLVAGRDRDDASLATFRKKARKARDDLDYYATQVATIAARVRAAEDARKARESETSPFRAQVTQCRRSLERLRTEKCDLEERLAAAERSASRAKFWIRGFKDIRLYVVDDVLQELDVVTAELLEEVGLHGWSVNYAVERETRSGTTQRGLHVTVRSPGSPDAVRWESWSGGERSRLRLVGSLALSQVLLNHAGVELGTEILDEPAQYVAEGGVRDICDMLVSRARALGRQIFYAEHRVVESSRFDGTLTVIKDGAGSRVEVR